MTYGKNQSIIGVLKCVEIVPIVFHLKNTNTVGTKKYNVQR